MVNIILSLTRIRTVKDGTCKLERLEPHLICPSILYVSEVNLWTFDVVYSRLKKEGCLRFFISVFIFEKIRFNQSDKNN